MVEMMVEGCKLKVGGGRRWSERVGHPGWMGAGGALTRRRYNGKKRNFPGFMVLYHATNCSAKNRRLGKQSLTAKSYGR
jgi:hypothetical protein